MDQDKLNKTLEKLYPIFTSVAVGDFDINVDVPEKEDELTPVWVGIKMMIETVNEKLREVEETKVELEKSNKQFVASNAELSESLEQNQRLMKTLQDLVSVIMHDFKGPVGNLKNLLTLRSEAVDMDEIKMFDTVMGDCVAIMDQTLKDLNEVIAARHPTEMASEVRIDRTWDAVTQTMMTDMESNNVLVQLDTEAGNELVYPQAELRSILQNFLSNSLKYRQKDRRLEIKISTSRVNGFTRLSFTDNGQGMDLQRNGKRLFRLFQRFHDGTEGKGMGLHLVKTQVESHGGKIEVESEPGEGTTFHVYLKDLKRLPKD